MSQPLEPPQIASLIAAMVEDARFATVRWSEGYDMAQVDNFLDDLVGLARNGHPLDSPVALVAFRPSRLREGYAMSDVDDFLDAVVVTVAAARRGGVVHGDSPAETTAEVTAADLSPGPGQTDPVPSVIQEQHSLLSRWLARRR